MKVGLRKVVKAMAQLADVPLILKGLNSRSCYVVSPSQRLKPLHYRAVAARSTQTGGAACVERRRITPY